MEPNPLYMRLGNMRLGNMQRSVRPILDVRNRQKHKRSNPFPLTPLLRRIVTFQGQFLRNWQHEVSELQTGLEDLAYFIEEIKRNRFHGVTDSNKWITIGGSYPGALSAWFRAKYPTSPLAHWLLALSYWQLRILEISTNRFFCRPTKVENFVLMPSGKSLNMLRTRFWMRPKGYFFRATIAHKN